MSNNKKNYLPYLLGAALLLGGCAELIEKDLSKKNVGLIAPSNNVAIPDSLALSFAWDSVDGATQYTLMVATPSFDSIVQLVADTVVTRTSLTLPALNTTGQYQWRVMASNNTSSTPLSAPWTFLLQ